MVIELTIRLIIKFTNELKIEFCSKKKDKKERYADIILKN